MFLYSILTHSLTTLSPAIEPSFSIALLLLILSAVTQLTRATGIGNSSHPRCHHEVHEGCYQYFTFPTHSLTTLSPTNEPPFTKAILLLTFSALTLLTHAICIALFYLPRCHPKVHEGCYQYFTFPTHSLTMLTPAKDSAFSKALLCFTLSTLTQLTHAT